jgi:hypothetical protein
MRYLVVAALGKATLLVAYSYREGQQCNSLATDASVAFIELVDSCSLLDLFTNNRG